MSRTLKFYGASDDLFEIGGTKGKEPDEIGCYDRPAAVRVFNDHAGLIVLATYAPLNINGCWSIGILPLDEDQPLPDWPMRWAIKGYSTILEMDVPDSAQVEETGAEQ